MAAAIGDYKMLLNLTFFLKHCDELADNSSHMKKYEKGNSILVKSLYID